MSRLTCELCHGHGYEQTEDGKEECSASNPDGEGLRERTGRDEMERYETFGYALAMRVLQSELYAQLDDKQKAECDELIARGMSVAPGCGACPGDGSICKSACRLAEESPPIALSGAQDDAPTVPHFRGYARLGIGQYLINHSQAGAPAELAISLATADDKAGRSVGEDRDNAPGTKVMPEAIAVRMRFENAAGLDALETQLRYLREVHFPDTIAAAVPPLQISLSSDAGAVTPEEVSALREQNAWLVELYDAVKNLIKVKGRHHTELAYQRVVSAFEKAQRG